MTQMTRLRAASLALLLFPFLVLLAVRPLDRRLGLTGTYYSHIDWSGAGYSRFDYQISTDALTSTFKYAANRPFAVSWRGMIAIDRPGLYRFEIVSDDGSTVDVDGTRLIDISGPHGPTAGRGEIQLERGLHPIHIDFYEAGGGWTIELFWARDGEPLTYIPSTALLHESIAMSEYTVLRWLARIATFAPLCWIAAAILLLMSFFNRREWFRAAVAELRWRPLLVLLIASGVLNALGVWWGFPEGWAPDEIGPGDILGGLPQFFSGGWYGKYPPFQFYLLSLLAMPFLAADVLRPSELSAQGVYETLFILNRLTSVVMATGTVAVCYACGRALKDRRAGLLAAAAMAVVLPFVYYAKVTNLDGPYLFWFAIAMLAYVHIILAGRPSSYYVFALAGMLSICTKDQAYGFFVLPTLHIVWLRYVHFSHSATVGQRVRRLLLDRVLLTTAAIAIAAFVVFDNLVFNFEGFVAHVHYITGGASTGYRMVPATFGGRMQLLSDMVRLTRWSLGWPLFLLAVAALVHTIFKRDRALWLLLPALSYYISFLNVVLYAYDRFLLGFCFVLVVILGCRLSEWTSGRTTMARAMKIGAALACAYAAVMVVSLDAMMIRDSRYAVRNWFRANVPHDALITLVGRPEYLPVLNGFIVHHMAANRIEEMSAFEFVVVNARFIRRYGPGTDAYALYDRIRRGDGYSLVLRVGPTLGWLPLARDPSFQSELEDPYTNLTKVDPPIEVYRRQ
jgi:hypothetical protein